MTSRISDEALYQYSKKWSLSDPALITKTRTSYIYKVQNAEQIQVLKIYTSIGQKDESKGAAFLALHNGNGAVFIHQYDDHACLMDYIDGPELKTLVENGKDDQATEIIGNILNKLHTTTIPKHHNFQSLEERFSTLANHNNDAPDIIKKSRHFRK